MRARRFGWFNGFARRASADQATYHTRLRLEPLEDRQLLSVGPSPLDGIKCMTINSPPVAPVDTSGSIVSLTSGSAGTPVILSEVPTSTWTYGCSATSAGMLFGYYDRAGYPDMYTGPANGGLAPLTDLGQGDDPDNPIAGACSIIATQQGFDGRTTRGHVDDYWNSYGSEGPDPWEAYGVEHTWGDCTADFLGTNQWKWDFDGDGVTDGIPDGGTWFYSYDDGTPAFDFIAPAEWGLPQTEGCHGLRLFAESRGYSVVTNYTQEIDTVADLGFSFMDLRVEIDAGRPVMTNMCNEDSGHTVLIVGYNTDGSTIYIHDTWDNETHWMTWGGEYAGMTQEEVTVLQLQVAPTADAGGPYTMNEGDTVTLSAKGSCDPTGCITAYAWDLDNDGQYDDGNEPTASFTTKIDGTYTVGLRVMGTSGRTDTDTATITVVNAAPTITVGDPVTIDEGSSLLLTATIADSGDDPLSSCYWDLDGDGKYDDATGLTTTFRRTADGVYTVGAKVTDNHATVSLVTANSDSDTVSVLRNVGDDTTVQDTYDVGDSPYCVAAANLDSDGLVDLVTANYGSGTVSVLLSRDNGTYLPHVTYAVGHEPLAVVTADINGDGKLDLVTANRADGTVSVLKNLGGGEFDNQVTYAVGKNPFSVTAADVTGDGKIDLITTNQGAGTVSVLRNLGSGTFAPQVTYAVGSDPVSVAAADLTGDGLVDLAVANYRSDTVSMLKNLGGGTFASQVAYAVGSKPRSVTAADVDGDGHRDLIAANSLSNTISVLENQGTGTFSPQITAAVGQNPYSVIASDIDGDGAVELVTANRGANTVSVVRRLANSTFAVDATYHVGSVPLSVVATAMIGDGTSIATATVTVENVAPTAYAGGSYTVDLGKAVRLSAAGTSDPGNDVVSYAWDLDGDAEYDDASGQVVYYTPPAAGTFTVSVLVTDNDGATDKDDATLKVCDPAAPNTAIPGDANRNGIVNAADAAILMAHWGLSGMTWAEGDFNGDGLVNADDAKILTEHWGATGSAGTGTSVYTTGSTISFSAVVGPVRSNASTTLRRTLVSASSRVPAAMSAASEAQAAATDAALQEESVAQSSSSSVSQSVYGALARSQTVARRQLRSARSVSKSPLAVDLILSASGQK